MDQKKTELIRFRCTESMRNAIELACQRTGMTITEYMEVASNLLLDYILANASPTDLRRINEYGADYARQELKITERI